jgi:hypothetical protein
LPIAKTNTLIHHPQQPGVGESLMVACFHLTPKNPQHESWQYSITRKSVSIVASAEIEARRRVANTLANEAANISLPTGRYQKIMMPVTPWELDDVTSCEECKSDSWPHPNYVIADDGEKWPTKY